ncbi:MAG: hypothetical protein ACTHK7_22060 [Aureliella sp.]
MKTVLCSLIILVSSLTSASAQSFSAEDLAELAALITEKTDDRWRITFTVTDRTLHMESRATIAGRHWPRNASPRPGRAVSCNSVATNI